MVQPGPQRPEYLLNNITSVLMHLRSQVLSEKVREAIDLTTGLYRINLSAFNDELQIFFVTRERKLPYNQGLSGPLWCQQVAQMVQHQWRASSYLRLILGFYRIQLSLLLFKIINLPFRYFDQKPKEKEHPLRMSTNLRQNMSIILPRPHSYLKKQQ